MRFTKIKKISTLAAVSVILPALVLAQGGGGGFGFVNIQGTQDVVRILNYILNVLLWVAIPVVAIVVIVGGFYMFGADEEKIKTGRKIVLWAAVGFAVILLAKGVTYLVDEIVRRGSGGGGGAAAPYGGGPTYTPAPTTEELEQLGGGQTGGGERGYTPPPPEPEPAPTIET